MNCPHCNHDKSRVTETRSAGEADRRIRLCQGCGRTFQTLERVCVYAGRAAGYIEAGPPPLMVVPDPPPPPPPAKARPAARHEASPEEECLSYVTPDARPLLVQWWNESRKSKHGAKATWTRAAWQASVQRVSNMPTDMQLALCRAGVEHGWQALKLDYIKDELAKPTAAGRPMPKDPAMLAALESWPKQTA